MASWEKRGENSYRLIAQLGYDANGKRLRETTTITLDHKPRKGELDLAAAKFEDEVKNGNWVKPGAKGFEAFVSDWKANYADHNLGDYTRKIYMANINTHLIPAFGRYQLDKITTLMIVKFMTSLRDPKARKDKRRNKGKPLSTNTILNIYKALKSIMDNAHEWKLIAKNPMDGVARPRADKAEKKKLKSRKKSYTSQEAAMVITKLYEGPTVWKLYFIGVLLGGYRRGEYLAVEWPDVDYKNGGIFIEKQITFDEEGRSIEGELKTEESEAFVPMPRWYMDELKQYEREWKKQKLSMDPDDWKGGDKQYLFHSGQGKKYYPNTPSLTWRRFLDKHKLPHIRLHDLRHTTAMLLHEYGADLKHIQTQLRHSKLGTTADIYMQRDTKNVNRGSVDLLDVLNPNYDDGHQMDTNG